VQRADAQGATALVAAVVRGHARLCTALLTAGASVRQADRMGFSALHAAVLTGNASMVALIGAAAGRSGAGMSSIHASSDAGHGDEQHGDASSTATALAQSVLTSRSRSRKE